MSLKVICYLNPFPTNIDFASHNDERNLYVDDDDDDVREMNECEMGLEQKGCITFGRMEW